MFVCGELRSARIDTVLAVYFWAKLWEGLVDLSLVTMRGFPVHIHFRLHHYSTPIFAWLGWRTASSHGYTFMLLNLFMHVMVYAFHGGLRSDLLHGCIRRWQYVQLFGGMSLCLLAFASRLSGHPCGSDEGLVSWLGDTVPAALYLMYYFLFRIELRDAAADAAKRTSEE
jgi:hypothetical protein